MCPDSGNVVVVDHFYIVLFSTLKQTYCACMWFYISDCFFKNVFEYPPKWCTYSTYVAGAMWNCCMQYFSVSQQWYGCQCQCLWFLMCAQMLCIWLHTGGCLDTTRVCTGSRPGGKLIAAPGAQTHVSIAPGFSARQSTNWAITVSVSLPHCPSLAWC